MSNYCCDKMDEMIAWDHGMYPADEDGGWSMMIAGAKYWVSDEIFDIFYCPFCGEELIN